MPFSAVLASALLLLFGIGGFAVSASPYSKLSTGAHAVSASRYQNRPIRGSNFGRLSAVRVIAARLPLPQPFRQAQLLQNLHHLSRDDEQAALNAAHEASELHELFVCHAVEVKHFCQGGALFEQVREIGDVGRASNTSPGRRQRYPTPSQLTKRLDAKVTPSPMLNQILTRA